MTSLAERAALVAVLREGRRSWRRYADQLDDGASAQALLAQDAGLFAGDRLDAARAEIDRWEASGIRLLTVFDAEYPDNLRAVHDRPPMIFVAGNLKPSDRRSIAVVGARLAAPEKLRVARAISEHLVDHGYTVVSGLAAGIDTAAHIAALARGGRTLAVIGTGLSRCYPPQNAELQRQIARDGAVVSQFWPEAPPTRRSFPMRNAVMSGLTLGTVVVEASHTSGARMQARLALSHGRTVFLLDTLLEQRWAEQLSERPGTYVVHSGQEITAVVERLTSSDALIA